MIKPTIPVNQENLEALIKNTTELLEDLRQRGMIPYTEDPEGDTVKRLASNILAFFNGSTPLEYLHPYQSEIVIPFLVKPPVWDQIFTPRSGIRI